MFHRARLVGIGRESMEVLTRNDSSPAERLYIKRFHSGAESARVVVSSIFFFMCLFQWLEWEAKVLLHFHSASSFRARGCSVGGGFLLCLLDDI